MLFKECHSDTGNAGLCRDETLLGNPYDIATSPDGKHAYVSSWTADGSGTGALLIYDRNRATGRLTRRAGAVNCYRDTPVAGDCTNVESMSQPLDVQVSPNGRWVYVAAYGSAGVTIFNRNAVSGRLTQKTGAQGCLKVGGNNVTCKPGRALQGAIQIIPSPTFNNLYATSLSGNGSIAILKINANGEVSQDQTIDGCVTESGVDQGGQACADGTAIGVGFQLAVSPDGRNVYGASQFPSAVTIFNRNTTTGGLTQLNGTAGCISQNGFPDPNPPNNNRCQVQGNLSLTNSTRISRDGRFLYALSAEDTNGSIVTFSRNAANGTLAFVRCLNEAGNGGCGDARMVSAVETASLSPDGRALAVLNARIFDPPRAGLSFFNVNPTNGVLTQRSGQTGCVSQSGSAPNGVGGTLPGSCRTVAALGHEGNVEFVSNTILNTAALGGAALVFDRDFAPVCASRSVTVPVNTAMAIGMSCSDANSDPITLQKIANPGAGTLGEINQATRTVFYNPFSNFAGADSFRYRGVARGVGSATATVSINVARPPDADGDGSPDSVDCDDRRPRVRPGAREIAGNNLDDNCDGKKRRGVFRQTVTSDWASYTGYTDVVQLRMRGAPKGAKGQVRCLGRGCNFRRKNVKRKKGALDFKKALRGSQRRFDVGQTVEVRVTKRDYNGKVVRYKIKSRKVPDGKTLCLPAGKKKPKRRC